ncbi:MAG: 30S ribosomal protein S20, partial [Candidatus Marinimicrobia bacterium]|nr:30S ribosomal protein S20 [Candidatus Neomarinimicrobiota bacterium]
MDRHAQQIKRERQDKARNEINSKNRAKMRTLIKKVLATKDQKKADGFYKETVSFI